MLSGLKGDEVGQQADPYSVGDKHTCFFRVKQELGQSKGDRHKLRVEMAGFYHAFSYLVGQVNSQPFLARTVSKCSLYCSKAPSRSHQVWLASFHFIFFASVRLFYRVLTLLIYPFSIYLWEMFSAEGSVWDVCYVVMFSRSFERFDIQKN